MIVFKFGDTYIETCQTIPTEDVFTPFAHHLGTTFVLFNGHRAHRTTFDQIIVKGYSKHLIFARGGHLFSIFFTRHSWMPLQEKNLDKKHRNLKHFTKLTGFLHPEQKSSRHVGQWTAHGACTIDDDVDCNVTSLSTEVGPTRQIVSQPAFGHHVRYLSNSTSAKVNE